MKRECISEARKKLIAGKQYYKCANNPKSNIPYLKNYKCVMWIAYSGNFDESGYEIDHIVEYSVSKDNSDDNLHALCISCHKVKTKRFLMDKNKKNTKGNTKNNNTENKLDSYLNNMNYEDLKRLAILLCVSDRGTKETLISKIKKQSNLLKITNITNKYNSIIKKLESLKNVDLGKICKNHNLYMYGSKYNIINRLLKNVDFIKLSNNNLLNNKTSENTKDIKKFFYNKSITEIERTLILLSINSNKNTRDGYIEDIINNNINLENIKNILEKYKIIINRLENFTTDELKKLCKANDLYISGAKYTIINRILQNIKYDNFDKKIFLMYDTQKKIEETEKYLYSKTVYKLRYLSMILDISQSGTKSSLIQRIIDNNIYLQKIKSAENYSSMLENLLREDLKDICRKYNLGISGTKSELVRRIFCNIEFTAIPIKIEQINDLFLRGIVIPDPYYQKKL